MKISNHKKAYKAIRKYVDLGIDLRRNLTLAQKRQISRYFNMLLGADGVLNRPHVNFRPRTKASKQVALAYAEIPSGFPRLEIIPLPSPSGKDTKIKIRRGKLSITSFGVTRSYEQFNKYALINNFTAETQRVINKLASRHAKLFMIQTGHYQMTGSFGRDFIAEELNRLRVKYAVGNIVKGTEVTSKNEFSVWANGLIGIKPPNNRQYSEDQWFAEFSKQRNIVKRKNRAKRYNVKTKTNRDNRRGN